MSVVDHEDLNGFIAEYLRANGMGKTADTIQNEIKSKYVVRKNKVYTKGL